MLRHNVRNYGPAIAAGLSMLVAAATGVAAENNGPAKVEEIPGSELKQVVLTPRRPNGSRSRLSRFAKRRCAARCYSLARSKRNQWRA